jgi:O-acetyl-ADP-ribose deacetylase (regulator of RNase III)
VVALQTVGEFVAHSDDLKLVRFVLYDQRAMTAYETVLTSMQKQRSDSALA